MNASKMQHESTKVSLSSTTRDKMRLCESMLMIEIETMNNCEDNSQRCARHEFSTSASSMIIDNSKLVKSRRVRETKTLDDKKDIFI